MRYSLHEIEKHHASGIELNRRPSQGPAPPTSGSGGLETGATASEIRRKATQIGPAYNKGVLQLASRGRQAKRGGLNRPAASGKPSHRDGVGTRWGLPR